MSRLRAGVLALLLAAAVLPWVAGAQDSGRQISESQRRLQEIRAERQRLRRELQGIQGRVGSVSAEIRIIQQQQQMSAALLREISTQLGQTERQIDSTTAEMILTQAELANKKEMLNRRLREIYKRGPLQSAQVLLSAHSFGDLLNRYKYLHLVARRDRQLVEEVGDLARELELREVELRRSLADMQYLHNAREQENAALTNMRADRTQTLTSLRTTQRQATSRLEALARDERRMTGLIAELERRRRDSERRAAAAAATRPAGSPAPSRPAASSSFRSSTSSAWTRPARSPRSPPPRWADRSTDAGSTSRGSPRSVRCDGWAVRTVTARDPRRGTAAARWGRRGA